MACPCRNKNKKASAAKKTIPETQREAENPLACGRCLEKHLCKAFVYAAEVQEEPFGRPTETSLALANICAACEHAEALGDERAGMLAGLAEADPATPPPDPATIAALLPGGGSWREKAVGYLGAAEDALRGAGDPATADKLRQIRLSTTNKE